MIFPLFHGLASFREPLISQIVFMDLLLGSFVSVTMNGRQSHFGARQASWLSAEGFGFQPNKEWHCITRCFCSMLIPDISSCASPSGQVWRQLNQKSDHQPSALSLKSTKRSFPYYR